VGKRKKAKAKAKAQSGASGSAAAPELSAPARRKTLIDPTNTWHAIALSLLSGVLWFLGCADFDIWPLAWFASVPSLWVIVKAPTRRRAMLYGWITGLVANLGGFYWISSLLVRFAFMPVVVGLLGLLLLAAYQAVVFWLFAWVVRGVRREYGARFGAPMPMALAAPMVMVTFELLVPFIFPWYLAITQAWVTPVIQIAELTGPLGVTALLMAVNGGIYDALTETTRRRRLLPLAGAAAFLAIALIFGFVRMAQIDEQRAAAPGVLIGVVQGNVGFDQKGHKRRDLAPRQLSELQQLSAKLERGEITGVDRFGNPLTGKAGADLVLWSESSYPYSLPRWLTDPSRGEADLPLNNTHRVKRDFHVPLIFGAITRNFDDDDSYPYNTALMIDGDDRFAGRFDKIFLLMFGEYVPGLETFDFIKKIAPRASSHFARGKEMVTFPFEHRGERYRLGPMICYEDILPDLGRELAELHPHLLVNLTNDAWFGETSEPWEHMALSVYRSVELRVDLVRAVNTGVSAFIDANGRVYHESYAMDPGIKDKGSCSGDTSCPGGYRCDGGRCQPMGADAIFGEAVLMGGAAGGGHTFYARFGNVFAWLCVLATFGIWAVWPRVRQRLKRKEATS